MNKHLIITGVAALIVGVGLGYLGRAAFAKAPAKSTFLRQAGSAAFGAMGSSSAFSKGGNQAFGSALAGSIAAKDSGSITLNTRDGSSRVILVTPDTAISKMTAGALSDLAVGSAVVVMGSTNSDGSVSATSIELRPAIPAGSMAQ